MARSLSNAKLFSAFIVDRISAMAKKGGEEVTKTSSWVPDPETGYYRPENHADDIDVAELREMLLKNNIRRH
ncbi:hypothetical protein CsSME_00040646 [Camellia sinensis var. sinensis]